MCATACTPTWVRGRLHAGASVPALHLASCARPSCPCTILPSILPCCWPACCWRLCICIKGQLHALSCRGAKRVGRKGLKKEQ